MNRVARQTFYLAVSNSHDMKDQKLIYTTGTIPDHHSDQTLCLKSSLDQCQIYLNNQTYQLLQINRLHQTIQTILYFRQHGQKDQKHNQNDYQT